MIRDSHHGEPCPYCRRQMSSRDVRLHPTRDHVIPRCRGGTIKIICCLTCNGIKDNMTPEAWEVFMVANPGWWRLSRVELRARRRHEVHLATFRSVAKRQGTPPTPPVVVPPGLIWEPA